MLIRNSDGAKFFLDLVWFGFCCCDFFYFLLYLTGKKTVTWSKNFNLRGARTKTQIRTITVDEAKHTEWLCAAEKISTVIPKKEPNKVPTVDESEKQLNLRKIEQENLTGSYDLRVCDSESCVEREHRVNE